MKDFLSESETPELALYYEKYKAGKVLLEQGEESNDKFYIILKGQVGVYKNCTNHYCQPANYDNTLVILNKDEKNIEYQKFMKKIKILSKKIKNNQEFNIVQYEKLKISLQSQFGKIVNQLPAGTYFGQVALSKPGQKRTASIICHTECEFAILLRKDFQMIKEGMVDEKQLQSKFLIKTLPGCSQLHSQTVVVDLLYEMEKKVFDCKKRIVQQGVKGKIVYLIYKGRVKLEKLLKRGRNMIQYQNNYKKKYEAIQVCQLNQNNLFGEEILYNKNQCYDYQVTILSKTATIYCFNKSFYSKCPEETQLGIEEMYQRRLIQRTSIIVKFLNSKKQIEFEQLQMEEEHKQLQKLEEEAQCKTQVVNQSQQNQNQIRSMIGHINDTQADIARKKRVENKRQLLLSYHTFFTEYRDGVIRKDHEMRDNLDNKQNPMKKDEDEQGQALQDGKKFKSKSKTLNSFQAKQARKIAKQKLTFNKKEEEKLFNNFISENLKDLQLSELIPDLSKHEWLKRLFTLRKNDKNSLIFTSYLKEHFKQRKKQQEKREKQNKKLEKKHEKTFNLAYNELKKLQFDFGKCSHIPINYERQRNAKLTYMGLKDQKDIEYNHPPRILQILTRESDCRKYYNSGMELKIIPHLQKSNKQILFKQRQKKKQNQQTLMINSYENKSFQQYNKKSKNKLNTTVPNLLVANSPILKPAMNTMPNKKGQVTNMLKTLNYNVKKESIQSTKSKDNKTTKYSKTGSAWNKNIKKLRGGLKTNYKTGYKIPKYFNLSKTFNKGFYERNKFNKIPKNKKRKSLYPRINQYKHKLNKTFYAGLIMKSKQYESLNQKPKVFKRLFKMLYGKIHEQNQMNVLKDDPLNNRSNNQVKETITNMSNGQSQPDFFIQNQQKYRRKNNRTFQHQNTIYK